MLTKKQTIPIQTILKAAFVAIAFCAATLVSVPIQAYAADSGSQQMYRLYNPYSGEHFYTASTGERDHLKSVGWRYEGVGWIAPKSSDTPVYRMYNRYAGDHHYTTSAGERNMLVRAGWTYEGIGWYSSDAKEVPIYRQYNPYAWVGTHNYTSSKAENDHLKSVGWRAEGIGWYGLKALGNSNGHWETVAVYETQAVYEDQPIYEEEPIYEDSAYILTSDGHEFATQEESDAYIKQLYLSGNTSVGDSVRYRKVQVGTKKVQVGTQKVQVGTKQVQVGTRQVWVED